MPAELWRSLDPEGPPELRWVRDVAGSRIVVLLGAFDPPTNAHIDVLNAAASAMSAAPVLGLTKVRLARPADALWDDERRLSVLDAIAGRLRFGLLLANRGTYLDVDRALRGDGFVPAFVIGTDKLAQLEDLSFYSDGDRGVEATFDEVDFLVVPREGSASVRRSDVMVLEPSTVFTDAAHVRLSATEIREMIARGADISGLVPPEVAAEVAAEVTRRRGAAG